MKIRRIIFQAARLAVFFCVCRTSPAQEAAAPTASPAKADASLGPAASPNPASSANPTVAQSLPVFGKPGNGAIRVVVEDQVSRPGIYYLPPDAKLKDAIALAGGFTRLFQRRASYVRRTVDAEHTETIKFGTGKGLDFVEIPLKDGDRVHCGELFD